MTQEEKLIHKKDMDAVQIKLSKARELNENLKLLKARIDELSGKEHIDIAMGHANRIGYVQHTVLSGGPIDPTPMDTIMRHFVDRVRENLQEQAIEVEKQIIALLK